MSLGPPIREPVPEVKAERLKVEGHPNLRRHSITGQLKTYLPQNEIASPPYGWPNYAPTVTEEP